MANEQGKGPLGKVTVEQSKPQPVLYSVFDLLARGVLRTHTPVIGSDYQLSADTPTPMPRAHALVFLRDPNFRVLDEHGLEIKPLPVIDRNPASGGILLRPGQVIATLDELTDSALSARCAAYPGSDGMLQQGNRDVIIKFILDTERQRAMRAAQTSRPGGSEFDDGDDMPEEQVSRMLSGVIRQGAAA